MKINVKKSGLWAFFDIDVRFVEKGEQEMKDPEAQHMIDNGRAEVVEESEVIETIETAEVVEAVKLESPRKKNRGKNK